MKLLFEKSVENIQASLNSDKNNGYFTRRPVYIFYDNIAYLRQECHNSKSVIFQEKILMVLKVL